MIRSVVPLFERFDSGSLSLGAEREPRFRLLSERDVLALPELEWLVDGLLPADASALLYGPPGIGKSLLALDLALTIASTAEDWYGRAIRPSTVIFVAAEGSHGLKRRLQAWRAATRYTRPLAIRFLDEAVQLRTLDDPRALLAAVDACTATADDLPGLVVLDTLSRCMAGLDENAAKDASAVVASLDYLRRETGCTTLVVHHTGIAETRERGSTVFRGAVDALLSLKESDGVLTLETDKQRDGPPLAPLHFRLAPVGESMVLVAADPAENRCNSLAPGAMTLLHLLRAVADGDGCTCTKWMAKSKMPKASFHYARKVLLVRRLVERKGKHYRLTAAGEVQGA
jgi:KaiC/GvpD/RAD55 family RecA-like ATPase